MNFSKDVFRIFVIVLIVCVIGANRLYGVADFLYFALEVFKDTGVSSFCEGVEVHLFAVVSVAVARDIEVEIGFFEELHFGIAVADVVADGEEEVTVVSA